MDNTSLFCEEKSEAKMSIFHLKMVTSYGARLCSKQQGSRAGYLAPDRYPASPNHEQGSAVIIRPL